jgi:PAS domain S-box-containing protein
MPLLTEFWPISDNLVNLIINPFSITLIITAALSLFAAVYVWRHRQSPGATPLAVFLFSATLWSAAYAFEIASTTLEAKLFWVRIEYIAIVITPTMLLFLVLQYTGRDKNFRPWHHLLLVIEPVIVLILMWTNEAHGLIYQTWGLTFDGELYSIEKTYGLGFWFHTVYSYLILVAGMVVLVQAYRRASSVYRSQTGILIAAALVPWLANALYILQLNPFPQLDLTPFAFTITGLMITWGLFRYQLFNLTPVAREVVIDSLSDGVIVLDTQERVVDINPAALEIFDLTSERVIGQLAEEALSIWPELIGQLKTANSPEKQIAFSNGDTQRYFNLRISPVRSRRGAFSGRTVLLHDVTESRAAQEQLRRLSRAVQQSASTILITNTEGEIEYVNPAFTLTTGFTETEVLGANPRILKSGEMPPETYQDMWDTLLRGDIWQGEIINKSKFGDLYWEAVSISPVKNDQGETTHYVAVKDDITQRKRMEEELVIARDRAVEANRLKGRILANISHDMRTPLGAILGYSEMLQGGVFGSLTEDQLDKLQRITESTNHLTEFVNNLLAQSELEAGQVALQTQSISIERLVQEIGSATEILAAQKGLAFSAKVAAEMPDTVLGDQYWLRRILSNLINNAIKFTDEGSVDLSIDCVDKEYWTIKVADTGHGIPLGEQANIFEAFQQGSQKGHAAGGSGLGLAIVKDVTELMGGRISLNSMVDQGSTFTVLLPLLTRSGEEE